MAQLTALQEILGVTFRQPSRLEQALVHSSYVNENPTSLCEHNERLEFLGDAILGFIVAEKLYRDFPGLSEGEMTKLRSALVRRDTLARVAQTIRLGDFLYLGKGEEAIGGRRNAASLAAALEAVIAAIFLDQGMTATRGLVLRLLADELANVVSEGMGIDYKSRLQELLQARRQVTPTYRLVNAIGPDHDKRFTIEVMAGDLVLGTGTGRSKKLAETEAARAALEQLPDSFTD